VTVTTERERDSALLQLCRTGPGHRRLIVTRAVAQPGSVVLSLLETIGSRTYGPLQHMSYVAWSVLGTTVSCAKAA